MNLSSDVITALKGKTLVTAESCTGGGIGAVLTAVPGSSKVYKGGIISYTNEVKINQLQVPAELLDRVGAVSEEVAKAMAVGVRSALAADVAVSVTGLAGPDGDDRGNPVGTVYIGYADQVNTCCWEYHFDGDRNSVRNQAIESALSIILQMQ